MIYLYLCGLFSLCDAQWSFGSGSSRRPLAADDMLMMALYRGDSMSFMAVSARVPVQAQPLSSAAALASASSKPSNLPTRIKVLGVPVTRLSSTACLAAAQNSTTLHDLTMQRATS